MHKYYRLLENSVKEIRSEREVGKGNSVELSPKGLDGASEAKERRVGISLVRRRIT